MSEILGTKQLCDKCGTFNIEIGLDDDSYIYMKCHKCDNFYTTKKEVEHEKDS